MTFLSLCDKKMLRKVFYHLKHISMSSIVTNTPILKLHETGMKMFFEKQEYDMDSYKLMEPATPIEIFDFFYPENNPCLPLDFIPEFFNSFRRGIGHMNHEKSMSTNFFAKGKDEIYFITYRYIDIRPEWIFIKEFVSNDPRSFYCKVRVKSVLKDEQVFLGLNADVVPCFSGNDIIVPKLKLV